MTDIFEHFKYFDLSQVFIEERTEQFIQEFNRLKDEGKILSSKQLAKALGYKGASSITEILRRKQNIPPPKFKIFVNKYLTDNSVYEAQNKTENLFEAGSKEANAGNVQRIIENLTLEGLQKTSIIERLVTILESQYGIKHDPKFVQPGTPTYQTLYSEEKEKAGKPGS